MAEFMAYAPAKVILFGEHFVVYGASGIVAAISPYNQLRISTTAADPSLAGLDYVSTIIENNLSINADGKNSKNKTTRPPAASPGSQGPVARVQPSSIPAHSHPLGALYASLLFEFAALRAMRVRAEAEACWPLKGVGNSASLSAAFSAGVRKACAQKRIHASAIFEDAQVADTAAHGGRPSGIDAAAAAYGGVFSFTKDFSPAAPPKIGPLPFHLPAGFSLILIDSLRAGERKASTSEQVEKFARHFGFSRLPAELSDSERGKITSLYEPIASRAARALASADGPALASCMNENQSLLFECGMSSPGIDQAVGLCLKNGAIGAKLSGAGGIGGAVLALCENKRSKGLQAALRSSGFASYGFTPAKKGAYAEKA